MSIFAIFDQVARVASLFDAVGAVGGLVADMRAGDVVGYEVPEDMAGQVRRALAAAGIEMIGQDWRYNTLRFSVRREDADRALAAMTGQPPAPSTFTDQAAAQLAERRARKGR